MAPETEVFTLFPQLPIELRLKIWKKNCYHDRGVNVTEKLLYKDIRGEYQPVFGYQSSSMPQQQFNLFIYAATRDRHSVKSHMY